MEMFNLWRYIATHISSQSMNILWDCLIGATVCAISCILLYVYNFYSKVKKYPSGPLPIPVLGNILLFRGIKTHPIRSLMSLTNKYGQCFTFWLGNNPYVFIFDLNLAKESFSKSVFSGRPNSEEAALIRNNRGTDILQADYSPEWESLRRVSHIAVRKYTANEKLAHLVSQIIDSTVEELISKEGIRKPFNPVRYLQLAVFNINALAAFDKKYTLDDEEYVSMVSISDIYYQVGNKLALMKLVPIFRWTLVSHLAKLNWTNSEYPKSSKPIHDRFGVHLENYEEGSIGDIADALITAKKEAITGGKEPSPHLTDYNLSLALWDLFNAGADTIYHAIQWSLLLLANCPSIQKKLRQEVESVIGDRMPQQEDKNACDYIVAFISEVLRFRPVNPLGATHKTMDNVQLGNLKIPANTCVIVHLFSICNDEKYWSKPEQFNPDRFLDDGKFSTKRQPGFIPFGIGRRMCIGDKLAVAEIFLILVRFLQATKGYEIELPNGPETADLEPDPNKVMMFSIPICVPKPFKIVINKS